MTGSRDDANASIRLYLPKKYRKHFTKYFTVKIIEVTPRQKYEKNKDRNTRKN